MPMTRLHFQVEPELFMDGLRLKFMVEHGGGQRMTFQKFVPMLDLTAESLLDLIWQQMSGEVKAAIRDHQRDRASAQQMA